MLNGKQTNYHNARNGFQLEELNRVRALGEIRDELGDEVLDEITPELFEQAKKRVAQKKEKAFKKETEKAQQPSYGVYSGYDHTPTIYGTTLNTVGLKNKADESHRRSSAKWLEETKVHFRTEPGKRHLPNFEPRSGTSFKIFQNPYGPKVDDVAAEFNTWELPEDDRDPVFKNKVEESIYRLRKKNPY